MLYINNDNNIMFIKIDVNCYWPCNFEGQNYLECFTYFKWAPQCALQSLAPKPGINISPGVF